MAAVGAACRAPAAVAREPRALLYCTYTELTRAGTQWERARLELCLLPSDVATNGVLLTTTTAQYCNLLYYSTDLTLINDYASHAKN